MAFDTRDQQRRDRGFTLIELLVVVAIVAIMAATSLPAIGTYIRNYRIKAAAQVVAGVMQSARSKAIMGNANNGVSFVTVDADSYRWVDEDKLAGEQLGSLSDLPIGIRFVAVAMAGAGPSLRFNRLGGFCNPAAGAPCTAAVTMAVACTEGVARCGREPGGLFVGTEAGGGMIITLLEENTGLRRTVRIAPGGRVLAQP
jgi:prepilin-type N-terminal cleavage/methylation domain-containing protein